MLPKNIKESKQYTNLLTEIKEMNKTIFWNQTIKRKLFFRIKQTKLVKIIEKLNLDKYELGEIKIQNYFSKDRIAVYTVIFGSYDKVTEPMVIPDNCDFFIITDQKIIKNSNWKKLNVDLKKYNLEHKDNIAKNRFFKMFPHLLFPEYKYSMYIDGNIKLMTDPTEYIHDMNIYGLKMHNHYRCNCVYKEIIRCIKLKKGKKIDLKNHKKHLIEKNMPKDYGLLEAPIILREHKNKKSIKLMEDWWYEFLNYSKRDQISLPYVLWKNGIEIKEVSTLGNDICSNYGFISIGHSKK